MTMPSIRAAFWIPPRGDGILRKGWEAGAFGGFSRRRQRRCSAACPLMAFMALQRVCRADTTNVVDVISAATAAAMAMPASGRWSASPVTCNAGADGWLPGACSGWDGERRGILRLDDGRIVYHASLGHCRLSYIAVAA